MKAGRNSAKSQSNAIEGAKLNSPTTNSVVPCGVRIRTRLSLLAALVLCLLCLPSSAFGAESITAYTGEIIQANGETETQAASHPYIFGNTVKFAAKGDGMPVEDLKNVVADLPPGLVGNPRLIPTCTEELLALPQVACPLASQVGTIVLETKSSPFERQPVFNMVAPKGKVAQFGFVISGVLVHVNATVTAEGPEGYHVRAVFPEISQGLPITGSTFELWGVPGDASHDAQRPFYLCPFPTEEGKCSAEKAGIKRVPFLSLPSNCSAGALTFDIEAESWQDPGIFDSASFSKYNNGDPAQITGCDKVPFDAALSVSPESTEAETPTGVDVELTMPQPQNPDGLSTGYLKRAEVTFPEGMSVNPASADGQAGCAPGQIGLGSDAAAACPDAAKIGSVEIETPVLEESLHGSIYLATPGTNPFGSLLALYIVAEGNGVRVKLPGKVTPDPQSGRLVASFDDNPQLPFSALRMHLKGGNRAALVTPRQCGTYTTTASFSPWSASDPDAPRAEEIVTSTSSFTIDRGPGGGACPPADSLGAGFDAGTVDPLAGAYSPLVIKATRGDGSQPFTGLEVDLPQGLLGKLAGIPYCPEASLAAAESKTGLAELASPSCPGASKVGMVRIGAGAGTSPLSVAGAAYLAGPYKGAPLSLAVVTPAVAGPFDLGTVVVRNALHIDPVTAQLHATSDPIPTILQGIPLKIRSIYINVDRDRFTLNPTSCEPMTLSGALLSGSASLAVSNPFKAAACSGLDFKPKLALRLSGAPPRRGGFPKLTATLTMPEGDANIRKAVVTMPETQFLENAHIRTVCTRVQYAADNCPKGSVYGYAKAWTPLLDEPLRGPVYLRSSNHPLPDLVASLDGQIHIDLAGRIDSVDARLRSTFWAVPDAPVSKFRLTMLGGRKGLLVNNTNLCAATPRADARFTGHNGKVTGNSPKVKVTGCGKKQRK